MTFSAGTLDTLHDSFAFKCAREDIIIHTNGKCHVSTFFSKKMICLSVLIPSASCVHFSHHVDHCVIYACTA